MKAGNRQYTIALAGNPNAGKTTMFNNLTGAHQHVGNYPGVTVEYKEGYCSFDGMDLKIVDLPGTYSLTANSLEERVARDFLLKNKPDVVVQVIDACSLERGLYMTIQLLELEMKVVVALNMVDLANCQGIDIDSELLAGLLGVSIVETVGSRGEGTGKLLETVVSIIRFPEKYKSKKIAYSRELGAEIERLVSVIESDDNSASLSAPHGWTAVKLLENDRLVREQVSTLLGGRVIRAADEAVKRIETVYGDHCEILVADRRYGFISGACQEAVRLTVEKRHDFSDRLDDIIAHRVLGIPIFFLVMYFVFWITFTLGEIPMAWIETGIKSIAAFVSSFWPHNTDSVLHSLLVEGVISGVGGVLVFLPNILILFAAISILEDTGYMARAAFLTDWMMHRIGLHGKSFIPMIVGFGCTVPGIMATRTLESRRDRLTTMMILPLMSCSARFPIYTLIIPAFFAPRYRAPVLWFIYVFGVLLAVLLAKVLRSTILAGESIPFVMELPLYRMPTVRGTIIHMWERGWHYASKAGTVILGASVLLWAAHKYPVHPSARTLMLRGVEQAQSEYLVRARRIVNETLPADKAGAVMNLLGKELEMQVAARDYHPWEAGYKNAEKNLRLVQSASETVRKFVSLRAEIIKVRKEISDRMAENNTLAVKMAETVLERLEKDNPGMASTVLRLLDQADIPYKRRLLKLRLDYSRVSLDYSLAGRFGAFLEPVLRPAGFDRRIATALLGAVAAKEIFVAQLSIVASVDTGSESLGDLRRWLAKRYRPLVGLCILLFCLAGCPCVATVAVTMRESGSWKWAALQFGGLTMLAYFLSLVTYQVGSLLGY